MKAGKGGRARAAGNLANARWRLIQTRRSAGRNGYDRGPGKNNPRNTTRPKGKK